MTPPLTAEQRAAYGPDWPDVSAAIRARAGQRCECAGECGWQRHLDWIDDQSHVEIGGERYPLADLARCPATNGQPSPYTGSTVVLTVAHLDRNGHEGTHDPDRLAAMCQGCHLAYDRRPCACGNPDDPGTHNPLECVTHPAPPKPSGVTLPHFGTPPEDWPTVPGNPEGTANP